MWCCQDFVTSVGEDGGTGWLDTVLYQVQDTRRRAGVAAFLMSGACTRPQWCETGMPWVIVSGTRSPGDTCVDEFSSTKNGVDMAYPPGLTRVQ